MPDSKNSKISELTELTTPVGADIVPIVDSSDAETKRITYTNLVAAQTSGIATNATNISSNATNISSNATNIATNAADIATNTADIATNTADIATNTANIATKAPIPSYSTAIDNLLSASDEPSARSAIGLGITDTVEFGELSISQLNFPDLTTSELNAVTDALAGDTYFDSDRGQFVRFTGQASYEVITTRSRIQNDASAATAAISLQTARFFESGLVTASSNVFSPDSSITIFTDDQFSSSSGGTYAYHDGSSGFLGVGWFDASNPFGGNVTGNVVVSGKPYRINDLTGATASSTGFMFNQTVFSDITDKQFLNVTLQGGSTYKIKVTAPVCDLAGGNLRFDFGYTGVYTDATIEVTCDNIKQKQRAVQLKYNLVENDNISFNTGTKVSTNSPKIAIYNFDMIITPSSDGVFTMAARQSASSVDPLLIDRVQTTISTLSS